MTGELVRAQDSHEAIYIPMLSASFGGSKKA